MRTWTFAFSFVLAACGAAPRAEPAEEPAAVASERDPGRPVEPGAGGVPENCPFRVADVCFDTSEAACAAEGCAPGRCRILESYPARIRCD